MSFLGRFLVFGQIAAFLLVGLSVATIVLQQHSEVDSGEINVICSPCAARDQDWQHSSARNAGSLPRINAVGDPQQVKSLLPAGATHVLHTKAGVAGALRPGCSWGRMRPFRVAYAFEAIIRRTVESNDGVRIVEVRHFEKVRMLRIISESKDLEVDLGPPEQEILRSFGDAHHVGTRRVDARQAAQAILRDGEKSLESCAAARAYVQVDSLSGKTARITYEDGLGVVSVEPIVGTLSESDKQLLAHTPVLADACFSAIPPTRSNSRVAADASQLAFLTLAPLRQIPQGRLEIERTPENKGIEEQTVQIRLIADSRKLASGRPSVSVGLARCERASSRIHSLSLEGDLADFAQFPEYGQECSWYSSLRAGSPLMLRLSYCCESASPLPSRFQHARTPGISGNRARVSDRHTAGLICHAPASADRISDDLGAARLVLVLLAVGCFRCGFRVAHRGRAGWTAAAVLAGVVVIFLFAVFAHGELWLAQVLPLPNVIVLGNLLPLGAGFLVGVLAAVDRLPVWRRATWMLVLSAAGACTLASSFPSGGRIARSMWSFDGVCLQTSDTSCSAGAAATLLADHGIPAGEQEMADLCLTKSRGTPILGLYRGLRLKTRDTQWDVRILRCDLEELRRAGGSPILLPIQMGEIGVDDGRENTPRSEPLPGVGHAVVLFGFAPDGRAEIGDPARSRNQGRVLWTWERLRAAYRGEGIRLVKRSHATPQQRGSRCPWMSPVTVDFAGVLDRMADRRERHLAVALRGPRDPDSRHLHRTRQ